MTKPFVMENFLEKPYANLLEQHVKTLPYFYQAQTNYAHELPESQIDSLTKDIPQMVHLAYVNGNKNSSAADLLQPLIDQIYKQFLISYPINRVKVNLTFPQADYTIRQHTIPHYDFDGDGVAGIYYPSDSDGNTLFFKSEEKVNGRLIISQEIEPKKNSLVIFSGKHLHSHRPAFNHQSRWAINFNFKP